MSGLDKIREAMAGFLRVHGVDAVTAWPDSRRTRLTGAAAAVSLRKCEGGPSGFQDYLGERFNRDTNVWEELYGKRLTVTFGLDLYAPAQGGAAACQAAFETLAAAFQAGGPDGLSVLEFSQGEARFQDGLFCCPVQAVCQCYLYAVAGEDGTWTDFEIKGVRI